MAALPKEKPIIRFSVDEMEAYMLLPSPDEGEEYTVPYVMQALSERGINAGIDHEEIARMVVEEVFEREVLIARGAQPVDGVDGYFEYKFSTSFDNKPKVRPDGSVDYWSVHTIESVVAGQEIAIYHPPVEGEDGFNVKGKPIQAKKGRDQMPIKGKGFEVQPDGVTYVATVDGKIEMQNNRIVILPVYEISGNAEISLGNIDFRGDVVIHGGVESGVTIRSTGSVTIDGVVEACTIEAGKDVILRSGMLGGNKASVKSKGNITAKFFEFTSIECYGDIQADVLMDCDVKCQGKVSMTGARGSIIGGKLHAIQGVEVTSLGNDAEKKTEIMVGAGADVASRLRVLEKKIEATETNLQKIEGGLKQFDMLEAERGVSYANDPRRMQLLRIKIRDTATLANDKEESKKLKRLVEGSRGACVSVLQEVYPGVIIRIGDLRFDLRNVGKSIEFYRLSDKISTRPCYQGVE